MPTIQLTSEQLAALNLFNSFAANAMRSLQKDQPVAPPEFRMAQDLGEILAAALEKDGGMTTKQYESKVNLTKYLDRLEALRVKAAPGIVDECNCTICQMERAMQKELKPGEQLPATSNNPLIDLLSMLGSAIPGTNIKVMSGTPEEVMGQLADLANQMPPAKRPDDDTPELPTDLTTKFPNPYEKKEPPQDQGPDIDRLING